MVRLTGACALVLLGCGAQLVFCRLLCVAAVLPTRAAMFLNRVFWCFLRLRICVGPGAGVSVPTVLSRQETRGHCPSFRVVVINHMVLFHLPPLLPSSLIPLLPPLSLLSLLSHSSLPPLSLSLSLSLLFPSSLPPLSSPLPLSLFSVGGRRREKEEGGRRGEEREGEGGGGRNRDRIFKEKMKIYFQKTIVSLS